MTGEEQAVECRRGLHSTIRSVHEWTSSRQSASSQLLHDMNGVLRAAVETNFGESCPDAIKSLYQSIDNLQSGMVSRYEEMPLFFFARSFAVVLEEAMTQLQQRKNTETTAPPIDLDESASSVWNCDTPTEDDLVKEMDETMPHDDTVEEEEGMKGNESVMRRGLYEPAASAAVAAAPPAATTTAKHSTATTTRSVPLPRHSVKKSTKIRDYSPKAIEGRLYLFNISPSALPSDIHSLLRPFGPILDFCQPYKGAHFCFAKMKSNEAADEAVAALDRSMLRGIPLRMQRATFTTKERSNADEEGRKYDESSLPPPRFGCYIEPPSEVSAAPIGRLVSRDSDDESEITSLGRSRCSSDFSVD